MVHDVSQCPMSGKRAAFNSVQTGCIVEGEAQKSPPFKRFSGGLIFSQVRLLFENSNRGPLSMGKIGSICHFSIALSASIWGQCSQALGAHKKGHDNDTFSAVFPVIWVSWNPQTL